MRRAISTLLAVVLALSASAGVALAAAGGSMTVNLNESRRIALAGAAGTVVVGDPTVADVAMVDAHSLILTGHGYGVTQLLVTDRAGHTLLSAQVTVVTPNAGRVTLTRGLTAMDFNCAGDRCHLVGAERASSGGGGFVAPSGAAGNTGEAGAAAAAGAPSPTVPTNP